MSTTVQTHKLQKSAPNILNMDSDVTKYRPTRTALRVDVHGG